MNRVQNNEVAQWLKQFGFKHGNPFALHEAEKERGLFEGRLFIEVEGYERIKEEQSVVVFAPLGGGKTALRIQLARELAPINPRSKQLAVEYTDFGNLEDTIRLTASDHVKRLLRYGCEALLEYLCGTAYQGQRDTALVGLHHDPRPDKAPLEAREILGYFLRTYYPNVLVHSTLRSQLKHLDQTFSCTGTELRHAVEHRQLHKLVEQNERLRDNMVAQFWVEVVDEWAEGLGDNVSNEQLLRMFVDLVQAVELEGVHFLIDGLDEKQATSRQPRAQVDLIESLLTELKLLEIPGGPFKFFVTQDAYYEMAQRSSIRFDRLKQQIVTVAWDEPMLRKLIQKRLELFSDYSVGWINLFCDETTIRGKDLTFEEWWWRELLIHTEGSPRRLLMLMNATCEVHIETAKISGISAQLERGLGEADWQATQRRLSPTVLPPGVPTTLAQGMVPLVEVNLGKREVRMGSKLLSFSPIEYQVLEALVNAMPNPAHKDIIATHVEEWEGVVSDENLQKVIQRIREEIGGKRQEKSLYIQTVRKFGYRLNPALVQVAS